MEPTVDVDKDEEAWTHEEMIQGALRAPEAHPASGAAVSHTPLARSATKIGDITRHGCLGRGAARCAAKNAGFRGSRQNV
eukprot:gene10213-biopygen18273